MNYVVVCPDKYCRGISILGQKNKTPSCRKCDKSYSWEKFKIAYETENHDRAVEARTRLLTKQSNSGPTFEEIKELGGLEEPERAYPDKDNSENEDNRSPKEIVLDAIENTTESTYNNIIQNCIDDGLSKEKSEKILERTLQRGYAIKNNGIIELI